MTTQLTAKKWKRFTLFAWLCWLGAIVEWGSGRGTAAPLVLAGIVLWLVGRLGAWWHHG